MSWFTFLVEWKKITEGEKLKPSKSVVVAPMGVMAVFVEVMKVVVEMLERERERVLV